MQHSSFLNYASRYFRAVFQLSIIRQTLPPKKRSHHVYLKWYILKAVQQSYCRAKVGGASGCEGHLKKSKAFLEWCFMCDPNWLKLAIISEYPRLVVYISSLFFSMQTTCWLRRSECHANKARLLSWQIWRNTNSRRLNGTCLIVQENRFSKAIERIRFVPSINWIKLIDNILVLPASSPVVSVSSASVRVIQPPLWFLYIYNKIYEKSTSALGNVCKMLLITI